MQLTGSPKISQINLNDDEAILELSTDDTVANKGFSIEFWQYDLIGKSVKQQKTHKAVVRWSKTKT